MEYDSHEVVRSQLADGVSYTIARMSFGRRIELTRRIRELASKQEFLRASESPQDKMDAAVLSSEIDRLYVLWGLQEVSGLEVDGVRATAETLTASGPEELFREALDAIKRTCGLTDAERKN